MQRNDLAHNTHSKTIATRSNQTFVPQTGKSLFSHEDFSIRLADTEHGRNDAALLINKMYSWRGYGDKHQVMAIPSMITLTASDQGNVIGTGTVNIDAGTGLMADEIFAEEIDARRRQGAKACEMIKLAFDPEVRSKEALASLFHILYIYAYRMNGCTDIFIEVNPRHCRFYETMLGFEKVSEVRVNPRVNAPAHLLRLDTAHVVEQVRLYGGQGDSAKVSRSLYPYFFSQREENGICNRLRSTN